MTAHEMGVGIHPGAASTDFVGQIKTNNLFTFAEPKHKKSFIVFGLCVYVNVLLSLGLCNIMALLRQKCCLFPES